MQSPGPEHGRWCEEHARWECTSPRSRGRGTCHGSAVADLDECRMHLGKKAGPAIAAAKATEAARRAVITYGLPRDISPADALLEEVRYTAGHVAWLREKVAELKQADLVWGVTEETDTQASEFPGTNTTRAAKPNAWLQLYREERKHLVDVTKAAISAGIEERKVRLAEQQGALVAQVIRAILSDLRLSAEQEARVPEVVPRHLRALAAG